MKFIILILIIFLLIGVASAESGNLTISAGSGNIYSPTFSASAGATPVWTTMKIYSTGYNHISSLTISGTHLSYGSNARSTSFTITSGGTGSGVVSYSKPDATISWFFSDTTITGSPLVLSYNENIFSDITGSLGYFCYNSASPASATPLYIQMSGGQSLAAACTGTTLTYNVQTQIQFSNHYSVNYTAVTDGVTANVTIDKSMSTVASQINISNSTANKLSEPTFNNVSFSYSFLYDTGIAIRMSDSAGNTDFVVVNTTSYTGPGIPTTPTPTPTVNPITGSGLLWDKNNYTLNEVGNLQYLTDSSIFDYGSTYRIEIYKNNPEVLKTTFNDIGISGSVNYQFNEVGSYTAKFFKWRIIDSLLDSKTVTASLNPSYVYINSTVPAGIAFNASYIFGNVVQSQGELNSMIFVKYNGDSLVPYRTVSLNNTNIAVGTLYNLSVTIGTPGKYKAQLFDVTRGVVAERIFNVASVFIPPTTHITTSYITMDNTDYFLSDNYGISYGEDDTNYSTYPKKYITISQANTANTTIEVLVQEDSFILNSDLTITGGSSTGFGAITLNPIKSGLNTVELRATNGVSDVLLASTNFSVSFIDSDGYGLDVTPSNICTGNSITIKYSAPTAAYINTTLYKADSDPFLYNTVLVNGTNKTYNLRMAFDGTYYINLMDSSGVSHHIRQVKASTRFCEVPTPTQTPTPPSIQSKTTDLLNGNYFIITVTEIAFAAIGLFIGGPFGALIGFSSGFVILSVLGIMPLWALFLYAISAFIIFSILFGKNIAGGGND